MASSVHTNPEVDLTELPQADYRGHRAVAYLIGMGIVMWVCLIGGFIGYIQLFQ